MKKYLLLLFCFFSLLIHAQIKFTKTKNNRIVQSEKYLSFNPFGLAEPQLAIGFGFGNRFSSRSEYFSELSYIFKTPFYSYDANDLRGFRLIAQYRYHFLQQWKPLIDLGMKSNERRARYSPFIAAEFRLKSFGFSGKNNFVNTSTHDTLSLFSYSANAVSIGGAVIFGSSYKLNARLKLEITAGIGAKQKLINYKNLAKGYEVMWQRRPDSLGPPDIDEAVGMPYFPCTIRIRYAIH